MRVKTIKVTGRLIKDEWVFEADAALELAPITLLVGPSANELLSLIPATRAVRYIEGKIVDAILIDKTLFEEAEVLIRSELNRMLGLAAEMRLMTDINDLLPMEPFVDALKQVYSLVADGEVHFLAVEPACGLPPQQAFFLGHLTAIFTKKVRERGIELYSLVSTNNLEFIRGAISNWTSIYLVRRRVDSKLGVVKLTTMKWEKRDVVPPFIDSAALAIKRGILDFGP